ncbi:unnamed protein product [Cyprideis torosa]|uniref:Uncharacterized protein n=1 Tax=Cyprideis torosa TaxID=163714 RepID=A0A7R8ZKB6_9CRUS|nr:unnamed protein product [Cyprideis torosa]CAG0890481.1 unnamed protein product [Cyprideis torosa]
MGDVTRFHRFLLLVNWTTTIMTPILLLTICNINGAPPGTSKDFLCPSTHQLPSISCSCDLPHTLRCTGTSPNGFETILQVTSTLTKTASPIQNISLLDLSISNVTSIFSSAFDGMALSGLVISTGFIQNIHSDAFRGIFSTLETLGLPSNNLSVVPENAFRQLSNLKRLDMSLNRIRSIGTGSFSKLTTLQVLDLSWNVIHSIAKGVQWHSLQSLFLQGNLLEVEDLSALQGLQRLRDLNLSNNNLQGTLPPKVFGTLKRLDSLSLSQNELTVLKKGVFVGLDSLRHLDLSMNSIDLVETSVFQELPQLQTLNLERNKLVSLSPVSKSLVNLNLAHNGLWTIREELINELPEIENLNLEDNDISIVKSAGFAQLKKIRSLNLKDNPLHCDCRIRGFASWLQSSPISASDRASAVCAVPPGLENAVLSDLSISRLKCSDFDLPPFVNVYSPPPVQTPGIDLQQLTYNGRELSLSWSIDTPVPYACRSLLVYEDFDSPIQHIPVDCDSETQPNPKKVTITLLDVQFKEHIAYRFCLTLSGNGDITGCSEPKYLTISPESKAVREVEHPSITAFYANVTVDDVASVFLRVRDIPEDCSLQIFLTAESYVLEEEAHLPCNTTMHTFRSSVPDPSKRQVCGRVMVPTTTSVKTPDSELTLKVTASSKTARITSIVVGPNLTALDVSG